MKTDVLGLVLVVLLCILSSTAQPLESEQFPHLNQFGPDNVTSYSGYIQVNNSRNLFFMFYESRSTPSTDPLILWLTGGPGCSSLLGLFYENGPYHIKRDLSLTINENSWNSVANVLYVDQPVGTGYSYSSNPLDIGVVTEKQVAENLNEFLCNFYKEYPQYIDNELFIFGESYAGHYVPAVSAYILRNREACDIKMNFAGSAIGNGLVDPHIQYKYYAPYAWDHGIVNAPTHLLMEAAIEPCVLLIDACSQNSTLGWAACINAYTLCNFAELMPIELEGLNPYDIRRQCGSNPLCYDFTALPKLLKEPDVIEALGVGKHRWVQCNRLVTMKLVFAGDWMLSFADDVKFVLENDFPVLVYAGDQDFICNYYGNHAWTEALDWEGQEGYNKAENTSWVLDGEVAGYTKSYDGLTFLQVSDAGHMVPLDQPEVALNMVTEFLNNGKIGSESQL